MTENCRFTTKNPECSPPRHQDTKKPESQNQPPTNTDRLRTRRIYHQDTKNPVPSSSTDYHRSAPIVRNRETGKKRGTTNPFSSEENG